MQAKACGKADIQQAATLAGQSLISSSTVTVVTLLVSYPQLLDVLEYNFKECLYDVKVPELAESGHLCH